MSSLDGAAGDARPKAISFDLLVKSSPVPARLHRPLGEFFRYAAASAAALAIDFGTLMLCTEVLGIHYLASAAIGFSLGIVAIYALSVRWVFAHRRLASATTEWTVFVAIGVAGLILNQLNMAGLTEWAGLPYQLSKIASTGVVFTFNFAARKALLFTLSTRRGPIAP